MFQVKSILRKISTVDAQGWRKAVQYLFLASTLLIGVHFTIFVNQLERGVPPIISRPPGIEAFLPVSSLISLKYWMVSGVFNRIHPSGLLLLLIILSSALLLKRGFCSWVCPFGLLTEYLNRLHRLIFKNDIKVPRWLDYLLRSLKYLLLFFFLQAIFLKMDASALEHFLYSPYNTVADIKMLHFFSNISSFALWTLVVLLLLSILLRNFWCRYLCPYGALLGGLSLLSILKVHRNEETCTDCRKCTRICPADIRVHEKTNVLSDECHACLKCVKACPEEETLYFSVFRKWGVLRPGLYVGAILLLFAGGPALARITGKWQNSISSQEYIFHVKHLNLSMYQHNRGTVPDYHKGEWLKKMQELRGNGKKTRER